MKNCTINITYTTSGYSGFLRHDITEMVLKVALNTITLTSVVLAHGHVGKFPGAPTGIWVPCLSAYVFLMLKHWFCWKYQYNTCIYMFNSIDHLHFCSREWLCSGCPSALPCPGVYNAVNTALTLTLTHI